MVKLKRGKKKTLHTRHYRPEKWRRVAAFMLTNVLTNNVRDSHVLTAGRPSSPRGRIPNCLIFNGSQIKIRKKTPERKYRFGWNERAETMFVFQLSSCLLFWDNVEVWFLSRYVRIYSALHLSKCTPLGKRGIFTGIMMNKTWGWESGE